MDAHTVQVLITIFAILVAAAAAVVCDILRNSNERLCDINAKLEGRQEQEQRRSDPPAYGPAQAGTATAEAVPPARATAPSTEVALRSECLPSGSHCDLDAAIRRAARIAAKHGVTPVAPPVVDCQPGATMDEARALARGLLGTRAARDSSPASGRRPQARPALPALSHKAERVRAARNWDALLGNPGTRQRGELIPFKSPQQGSELQILPHGFQTQAAASQLLESRRSMHGLIVAIGVNGIEQARISGGEMAVGEMLDEAASYLCGLLEPDEFACQTAPGEYVVISEASDVQRRFIDLSSKLAHFRMRRFESEPALFCCAAFEADGEPLADAIRGTFELMRENRLRRTPGGLEIARRRKVV